MNRNQEITAKLLKILDEHKAELALDKKHYGALTYYLLLNQRHEEGLMYGHFKEYSEEGLNDLQDFLQTFYKFTPDPAMDETIRMAAELDIEGLLQDFERIIEEKKASKVNFPTLDATYSLEESKEEHYTHTLDHESWRLSVDINAILFNSIQLEQKSKSGDNKKVSIAVPIFYKGEDFISYMRVFAGFFNHIADLEEQE